MEKFWIVIAVLIGILLLLLGELVHLINEERATIRYEPDALLNECRADCGSLGHRYWKYENPWGESDNCWCLKDNNETTQVW